MTSIPSSLRAQT